MAIDMPWIWEHGLPLESSYQSGLRPATEIKMNDFSALGGLIPLWILGAGLALGVLEWMTTPRSRDRSRVV